MSFKMDTMEMQGLVIKCEIYSNRNGWGHRAFAYYNSELIAEDKIRYYNRTWERYTFESILKSIVNKLDKSKNVPFATRYAMYKKIKNRVI